MPFETLIAPAINLLLRDGHGVYRCERDLHHHLTVCFNAIRPLDLGRASRAVRYEEPTLAKYSWSRDNAKAGNVDIFIPDNAKSSPRLSGSAVEVNYGYREAKKIMQDFVKLLDPTNRFCEAVYVVYGKSSDFSNLLEVGYRTGIEWLHERREGFELGVVLRVLLIDYPSRTRSGRLRIGTPDATGQSLTWAEVDTDPESQPPNQFDTEEVTVEDQLIDRAEARGILMQKMESSGIPLGSVTTRCMFEATNNGRSKFGTTPLWDNELRLTDGKILRSEFDHWLQLLVLSGQTAQTAATVRRI